jgi:hydroxymethylpyrimidine pyrophosphatase-like HAD family hydrolase
MKAAFYKSTQPGVAGIYNRAVRWWTRGQYSHVELVFGDGVSASSSFTEGGVRFKTIVYNPDKWDFIDLPDELEEAARTWFKENEGKKYDLLGNAHFIFGFIAADQNKYFCSEAIASSLGITDAWRFEPNVLAAVLILISRKKNGNCFI